MEENIPERWKIGFRQARGSSYLSNARMTSKRMGAVLVNGKNVVSRGYNMFTKSHPEFQDIDEEGEDFLRNSHAELMALVRRKHHDVNNLTMYVWRSLDDGTPANSRPCRICMKLIKEFGVKRVRFIDDSGNFVEEKL
jgi:deoxycytidylate deaminase